MVQPKKKVLEFSDEKEFIHYCKKFHLMLEADESEITGLKDPHTALRYAQKAVELREDWRILDTLALAQYRTGDPSSAVETQTRAVELMPKAEPARDELEARLKEFREALKEQAEGNIGKE